MVKFLCSEKAGFITGENICIDGRMTRQMIYLGEHGWSFMENGDIYESIAPKGQVIDAFYTGLCAGSASAFFETYATIDKVRKLMTQMEITGR